MQPPREEVLDPLFRAVCFFCAATPSCWKSLNFSERRKLQSLTDALIYIYTYDEYYIVRYTFLPVLSCALFSPLVQPCLFSSTSFAPSVL